MTMKITYHGHACFSLESPQDSLIFDPFITGNSLAKVSPEDIKTNYILPSHFHGDHFGDTEAIASKNDATIISTAEIAGYCLEKGLKAHKMHIGGKHPFSFGWVKLTPAYHGSGIVGGLAAGFLVNFAGKTLYFAGDTGLFRDMELIGDHNLDLAFLPIGDNFTMGPEDAVKAVKMLKPATVIPMHYNTWPVIETDPEEFCRAVEKETSSKAFVLPPGESMTF
jgi:L-ascorbate metabolism protein UlaG (beta-lactamase superfamily)